MIKDEILKLKEVSNSFLESVIPFLSLFLPLSIKEITIIRKQVIKKVKPI